MMYDKHLRLISHLVRKSRAGELEWQTTPDENAFQVSFKRNTVRISSEQADNGVDYFIELINSDGVVAETFSDVELDNASVGISPPGAYSKMRELHEMARRSALGSDKVLNEILSDLDDEIPF